MTNKANIDEKIVRMEDELRRLQEELEALRHRHSVSQFEQRDTDIYLVEVYNA